MPKDRICKTTRQYSEGLIPDEDMGKLLEIAGDYAKVKAYPALKLHAIIDSWTGFSVQKFHTYPF